MAVREDIHNSRELVHLVEQALDEHDIANIESLLLPLHPADLADIIEALSATHQRQLVIALKGKLDFSVLTELDDYTRDLIIEYLTPQEVAAALTELTTDEAVQIIADLDEQQQQIILKAVSYKERISLKEALSYPEETAGRLMQHEYVCVPDHFTVGDVQALIRSQINIPARLFDIFVVDNNHCFRSSISIGDLLRYEKDVFIHDISPQSVISVSDTMSQEDVSYLFQKYGLTSIAVLNENQHVVGMIAIDEAMSLMHKEVTENFMSLGGVVEGDFHASVFHISVNRFRWLFITFLNTLIASSVLYHFQDTLQSHIALAVLLPIVASMGGNAGMQVVTVIVRAISERDLKLAHIYRVLGRELIISASNAVLFSLILASITTLWYHDILLGGILAAAMIFNMLWSAVAGTIFPLALHRMGLDPAISAGPLLTTTTDVLGFTVFLGLAKIFLSSGTTCILPLTT